MLDRSSMCNLDVLPNKRLKFIDTKQEAKGNMANTDPIEVELVS